MTASSTEQEKIFIGPGIKPAKLILTLVGVLGIVVIVLLIAIREGVSASGSTIVALLFIVGFLIYLRIVAPIPFTISLEQAALVKRSRNGEVIEVRWKELTRIKEEFFPNGKRISITVYRKPTSPQQKAKAWAVYRDDVTDIDGLAQTLKATIPPTCEWQSETVHE